MPPATCRMPNLKIVFFLISICHHHNILANCRRPHVKLVHFFENIFFYISYLNMPASYYNKLAACHIPHVTSYSLKILSFHLAVCLHNTKLATCRLPLAIYIKMNHTCIVCGLNGINELPLAACGMTIISYVFFSILSVKVTH